MMVMHTGASILISPGKDDLDKKYEEEETRSVQSGASCRAKHGGTYFSTVRGSLKD